MTEKHTVFVDPGEKEVASLHARAEYLDPNKDYCVLTEKRLYHKGKRFSIHGISAGKCETIINLQNVTATFFSAKRHYIFLVLALLFLGASIATVIMADGRGGDGATGALIVGFGLTILFALLFIFLRRKIFSVIYSGGELTILANNCSIKTLRAFGVVIHATAEKARKVEETTEKPAEAEENPAEKTEAVAEQA